MSVPSVQIAKERLHTLLTADRIQCTPDTAEKLSSDIHYTISKYMDWNTDKIDIQITRSEIHIRYTGEEE